MLGLDDREVVAAVDRRAHRRLQPDADRELPARLVEPLERVVVQKPLSALISFGPPVPARSTRASSAGAPLPAESMPAPDPCRSLRPIPPAALLALDGMCLEPAVGRAQPVGR